MTNPPLLPKDYLNQQKYEIHRCQGRIISADKENKSISTDKTGLC